jgi:hypothetical protein
MSHVLDIEAPDEIEARGRVEARADLVPIEEFRLAERDRREAAENEFDAFARAVRADDYGHRRKKRHRRNRARGGR